MQANSYSAAETPHITGVMRWLYLAFPVVSTRVAWCARELHPRASLDDGSSSGRWFGAMEHHHVADAHDEMARGFFSEQGREFLLLFFEVGELDLHEFVLGQGGVDGLDETFAQTGFADFEHGVQKLGGGFEFAELLVVQWFEHRT